MSDPMMRLQWILSGLALTYVLTFLCGFLQATSFNFLNFIAWFVLFAGGVYLLTTALHHSVSGAALAAVILTSLSTLLLFSFYLIYEVSRQWGYVDVSNLFEGFLYLLTLLFWVALIVSVVLVRRSSVG
ncbi:MAG: hypothetical protein AAF525_08770 [Pseudomonadota bacterium]